MCLWISSRKHSSWKHCGPPRWAPAPHGPAAALHPRPVRPAAGGRHHEHGALLPLQEEARLVPLRLSLPGFEHVNM